MILAGDFGGSSIKLGLVHDGVVCGDAKLDSPARTGFDEWLPVLKEETRRLCGAAGASTKDLEGIVCALPLVVHPGLRRASRGFGKFDDTTKDGFATAVESFFGVPVLLENDARAAAIGEWQEGAGRGFGDLVMITLGTGIGTGVILEGRPLRGRSGMAGNLGGLSITHLGLPVTGTVAPGCIEGRVATWALPAKASRMPEFSDSPLASASPLDYRAVFAHAAAGDLLACRLRDDALEAWGALTLNLIQAYDPERVILGGGIMASGEIILPAIRDFVNQHAVLAGGPVDVVAGTLGDSAALLGCEWIWNKEADRIR